jgi:hypothetical protein
MFDVVLVFYSPFHYLLVFYVGIFWFKFCSQICPVSVEHLPEDGHVRPEHVAVKCNFNDILK